MRTRSVPNVAGGSRDHHPLRGAACGELRAERRAEEAEYDTKHLNTGGPEDHVALIYELKDKIIIIIIH